MNKRRRPLPGPDPALLEACTAGDAMRIRQALDRVVEALPAGVSEETPIMALLAGFVERRRACDPARHPGVEGQYLEAARALLTDARFGGRFAAHRAGVHEKNPFQGRFLHQAVLARSPAMVTLLIRAGANPEAGEGSVGGTALHAAARGGDTAVCRALVEAGANPFAWDLDGDTPKGLAEIGEHAEAVAYFEEVERDRVDQDHYGPGVKPPPPGGAAPEPGAGM